VLLIIAPCILPSSGVKDYLPFLREICMDFFFYSFVEDLEKELAALKTRVLVN
jgi:hypothetical protein